MANERLDVNDEKEGWVDDLLRFAETECYPN